MPRKKNHAPGLGNLLIKDRFGKKKVTSHIHAAELSAEHNDADANLKSVTELSSLDDFLATAELAGTEFSAQKLNIHFVDSNSQGVLTQSEEQHQSEVHQQFQHLLGIPRRPEWNENMTKEELEEKEKAAFLTWRRQLAIVQEKGDLLLTPYEKNLDFWRQLWRVIERSDVVVQIVDARDPLLFRCKDLETYVKQVNPCKKNLLLVNKADLLSVKQRRAWQSYFEANNMNAVFWSAVLENEKLEEESKKSRVIDLKQTKSTSDELAQFDSEEDENRSDVEDEIDNKDPKDVVTEISTNDSEDENDLLLSREELICLFKSLVEKDSKVIGMVGYPNVGKSSTVNTLMGIKKAAVSATPGRTKHFQTLHIDNELCLCDCPGLVFPSFVSSKAEMVLSGILPIDQMRDHVGPVNLLSFRVHRKVIEGTYGVNIARPKEGEDPNRCPTSAEILNAHALSRGFMTSHGQPDNSRSSRIILKDYVNGKLLFSVAPPGFDKEQYKKWTVSKVEIVLNNMADSLHVSDELQSVAARISRVNKTVDAEVSKIEKEFFDPQKIRTFVNGRGPNLKSDSKKHRNKKKEKVRRIRKVEY